MVVPDELTMSGSDPAEQPTLAAAMHYQDHESGYSKQQSTRPQTLAYSLADSPAGQMAWIVEKYATWTDCVRDGIRHPENAIERNVLLDIVTHYWMTNTGAAARGSTGRVLPRGTIALSPCPSGYRYFPRSFFVYRAPGANAVPTTGAVQQPTRGRWPLRIFGATPGADQ